ncbi:MAG: hypothetical protein IKD70_05950 [Eggerthellaceae bacterium]|nr:hypothetical protein [Eggerthellaceae bacterium]
MATIQQRNEEKRANYAEQKKRYASAFNGGYHLECIFISYAMIEDRILSILTHLRMVNVENAKPSWRKSPKDCYEAYKRIIRDCTKASDNLPQLRYLQTKLDALKALAEAGDADEDATFYEHWLRSTVRDRLRQSDVSALCDQLMSWKERRNELTHALFALDRGNYSDGEFRRLAEEGMELARAFDNVSGQMKTCERQFEKAWAAKCRAQAKNR